MPKNTLLYSFSDFIENARREKWNSIALIFDKAGEIPAYFKDDAKGAHFYQVSTEWHSVLFSEISSLEDLTELYITGKNISNLPPEIGNGTNLRKILITQTNIFVLPKEIGQLANLREVYIYGNPLESIPEELGQLVSLEILEIVGSGIQELPNEIGNLRSLKRLDLSENNLLSLPRTIGRLSSLEYLDLFYNTELTRIPTELGQLESLRELMLSDNYLHKEDVDDVVQVITNLKRLKILAMINIGITSIPPEFARLTELEDLDLHYNSISDLPIEFAKLSSLKNIDLNGNEFEEIPDSIYKLQNLESLYMSENRVKSIGPRISNLKHLKILSFGIRGIGLMVETSGFDVTNEIKELPYEIATIPNLEELDLTGNPIPIPPEILEKTNDPKAILNYYFSLSPFYRLETEKTLTDESIEPFSGALPLNETKLLIVGQGSVGKTSLVHRLIDNIFDQNQTKTEGISINHWELNGGIFKDFIPQLEGPLAKIRINFWDFGGQEIMHATHQFFLTKRSLYLLVLDSRLTQEENRVEYWLKIIQSFGGESPVLVVGNKTDQHPLDIDRTGLQKKYPNIVGILETSAATGAGIEELKAAITEQVNNLPHVRDLLPETWFTVKTKLEELGRESNFITHDKYLDLCDENEVSDETSQRTLIGFLHDLGVVLHFQDDPRLEALGILNPQWVTNGVYKILNSHTLFQNKGVLTTSMLDEILNLPEYPRGKRLFIVDMMKKFELCYEMPYGYDIESDKTFLVPDLLPKDEPTELKFNGVPAFEYAYPVLPSSVITRFIVRMNQKIDDGFVWRTGVVLKIGENKALVKADIEDRKITIAIDGVEYSRRDALSAIRYELGEIHNSIKGLNPQQRVPVPNAPLAEPLKYDYLLKLERAGQETVLVENGNDLVIVNVRQMLSAIESEAQRKEQQGNIINNIYVGGNFEGNLLVGDKNQVIQNSYNKIKSADIAPELKETMKQLAEAVNTMLQKLPTDQAAEAAEDFGKLADEAVKPKPNKKWYSVSIEGLIKAAENLDKLGTPVISLSRKVLSLLTGGANKHAR